MASRFFFNGVLHTTPVAVSAVDDRRMAPQNAAVGNNVAVVGTSLAGTPNTAYTFSSPREAERVLFGGEGLTAVRKCFSPSAATGGPGKVTFVRVGTATQSALVLMDAAGTPAASINLTSSLYGIPANRVRVSVAAGSVSGKLVTTRIDSDYYVGDNLGAAAFKIRYAGALAFAKIDITPTTLVLKGGAIGTEVLSTITLTNAPTVQQLCDQINGTAGFTATVTGNALRATVNGLDGVIAQDVKTADYFARADLAAIIEWMNSAAEGVVVATRASGATAVPANIAFTFLTGATDPAVIQGNWVTALDVLTNEDVQHIVTLSGAAAVHLAGDAHCLFMSGPGRQERRHYSGPDAGTTLAAVKLLPAALSSDRTALCWPGHYDTDLITGERTLLPAYMTAVHVAGGFAGMNPGNALTNKTIRVEGLELNPSFPAETDALIQAGVLTFTKSPRGIKCARSISTWLGNDNFNRVEISTGIAVDYMVRAVREAMEPLVGTKASPQTLSVAYHTVDAVLLRLSRPEPGGPGVIVGDKGAPAYRNIFIEISGDVMNVAFEASPAVPLNFIAIAVSIVPYTGSVRL